nr:MAG TPA: hypothetical protein [Caudoviricetes sp.]
MLYLYTSYLQYSRHKLFRRFAFCLIHPKFHPLITLCNLQHPKVATPSNTFF